ncbi:MAG: GAF domain-containing protein [Lysobacter sp.]|nr:MAG: GAF domain-containing protein [Lysobacter sp.]
MPISTVLDRLRALLREDDLRGTVILLNSMTPHRFTSLFRFGGDTLHNVVFYDRENPDQERMDDIPVAASYCVFVRDGRDTFVVPDATDDPRVEGHPKQPVFRSYCGVPLVDADGRMFGTVCHFDFHPRPGDPKTIELLEAIAPYLPTVVTGPMQAA